MIPEPRTYQEFEEAISCPKCILLIYECGQYDDTVLGMVFPFPIFKINMADISHAVLETKLNILLNRMGIAQLPTMVFFRNGSPLKSYPLDQRKAIKDTVAKLSMISTKVRVPVAAQEIDEIIGQNQVVALLYFVFAMPDKVNVYHQYDLMSNKYPEKVFLAINTDNVKFAVFFTN